MLRIKKDRIIRSSGNPVIHGKPGQVGSSGHPVIGSSDHRVIYGLFPFAKKQGRLRHANVKNYFFQNGQNHVTFLWGIGYHAGKIGSWHLAIGAIGN
jgi:hypothetical protein